MQKVEDLKQEVNDLDVKLADLFQQKKGIDQQIKELTKLKKAAVTLIEYHTRDDNPVGDIQADNHVA